MHDKESFAGYDSPSSAPHLVDIQSDLFATMSVDDEVMGICPAQGVYQKARGSPVAGFAIIHRGAALAEEPILDR